MSAPTEDEIFEEAKRVADGYARMHKVSKSWEEWSVNAREDYWDTAQMDLGVRRASRTPLPEKFARKP